eukprot:scaffold119811_cov30-Phaeocystis_antarctica.AAC.1
MRQACVRACVRAECVPPGSPGGVRWCVRACYRARARAHACLLRVHELHAEHGVRQRLEHRAVQLEHVLGDLLLPRSLLSLTASPGSE